MSRHCCDKMDQFIFKKVIDYEPIDRTYGILYDKRRITILEYCPWCAKAIPKRLVKEFLRTLKKEHGIEFPDFPDLKNVPEEFRSDEWWKKRGL